MWGDISCDDPFQSGNDWLVTNLSEELSANLETSPLFDDTFLSSDLSICDNGSKTFNPCESRHFMVKEEMEENVCLEAGEVYGEFTTIDESPSSRSSSSSEMCYSENGRSIKEELDTPPVTPPNVVPSENICLLSIANGNLYPLPVVNAIRCTQVKAIAAKPPGVTLVATSAPVSAKQQEAQRRQERILRNRETASRARMRAKEKASQMEEQIKLLTHENAALRQENAALKKRLAVFDSMVVKRSWRKIPVVPVKTTALLAIAVTICFNLNSFSLLDDGRGTSDVTLEAAPSDHHSRSLLWVNSLDDSSLTNLSTSCPLAINQTESLRLERELREWIVGGEVSSNFVPNRFQNLSSQKVPKGRRKRIPRTRKVREFPHFPLDMWGVKASLLNLEGLYEAIHRRADTFYLVSFSADHLLLPAVTSNNATHRPKMSFMLPAFLANSSSGGGGRVEMMQIDCEVTNTQLLSVSGSDIPSHLRQASAKFPNASISPVAKNQLRLQQWKLLTTTAKSTQNTQLKKKEQEYVKEYTETPRPVKVKTLKKFREPFPKSIFVGNCDAEVLEYPEVLNLQEIDRINQLADEIQASVEHEINSEDVASKGVSKTTLGKLAELKLLGAKLPEHYHGLGLTETETAVVSEAISSDANVYKYVNEQLCLSGALIAKYGSEEQKLRYLVPMILGKSVLACAYQEDTSLSEAAANMASNAIPHGNGGYQITGKKLWVYNAAVADTLVVFAATMQKDDTGQRNNCITGFIVPSDTPGLTIHPPMSSYALSGVSVSQVDLNEVVVPADAVLGKASEGGSMILATLGDRFDIAPLVVGVGKKLLEQVTLHAINTNFMGAALNELEGIQARVGRMATVVFALESALYLQKGNADQYENADSFLELCILKVLSSEVLQFLTSESLQLLGPNSVWNDELKYLKNLLSETAFYAVCDETNLNLKSAIALSGLQHAGLKVHDEIRKVRNPLMFPSFIMKRLIQGKKRYGGDRGKDLGLAGYLHPTLTECAHQLEYCISRLHMSSEILLGRYGRNVVDKHIKLALLADAAIATYVLIGTLGRASRSYCIGLAEASIEMEMAQAVTRYTEEKVSRITANIEEGPIANNTMSYAKISERIFFSKGYCMERPIARNF